MFVPLYLARYKRTNIIFFVFAKCGGDMARSNGFILCHLFRHFRFLQRLLLFCSVYGVSFFFAGCPFLLGCPSLCPFFVRSGLFRLSLQVIAVKGQIFSFFTLPFVFIRFQKDTCVWALSFAFLFCRFAIQEALIWTAGHWRDGGLSSLPSAVTGCWHGGVCPVCRQLYPLVRVCPLFVRVLSVFLSDTLCALPAVFKRMKGTCLL